MAITDQEKGVWDLDQVYNKINEGGIWIYTDPTPAPTTFAWGYGQYGMFGNNEIVSRSSPIQISSGWSFISNTSLFANLGTKTDGSLWSWGSSQFGKLGLNQGPGSYLSSPAQIAGSTWSTNQNALSSSFANGAALKTDGTLWIWGANYSGSLGLNQPTTTYSSSPAQIPGTTWSNIGGYVSNSGRAIKTDGTLWVWGENSNTAQLPGALGLNDTINRSSPTQLPGTWSQCAATPTNSYGIKTDGSLWAIGGANVGGQLGQNQGWAAPYPRISSPTQIGTGTDWALLPKGGNNSIYAMMAIKTNGTLWTWGRLDNGQLGLNQGGLGPSISSPTQVPGTNWSEIRWRGAGGMLGSKTDGTLWAWGDNANGSMGNNTGGSPSTNEYSSPVQIPGTWVNSPLHGVGNAVVYANRPAS